MDVLRSRRGLPVRARLHALAMTSGLAPYATRGGFLRRTRKKLGPTALSDAPMAARFGCAAVSGSVRAGTGSACHLPLAPEKPRERVLAPANPDAIQALVRDAVDGHVPSEIDVLNPQLSVPHSGQPQLRLLHRVGQVDATSIDDYRSSMCVDA